MQNKTLKIAGKRRLAREDTVLYIMFLPVFLYYLIYFRYQTLIRRKDI